MIDQMLPNKVAARNIVQERYRQCCHRFDGKVNELVGFCLSLSSVTCRE